MSCSPNALKCYLTFAMKKFPKTHLFVGKGEGPIRYFMVPDKVFLSEAYIDTKKFSERLMDDRNILSTFEGFYTKTYKNNKTSFIFLFFQKKIILKK